MRVTLTLACAFFIFNISKVYFVKIRTEDNNLTKSIRAELFIVTKTTLIIVIATFIDAMTKFIDISWLAHFCHNISEKIKEME